jgi:hypothetical protein
VSGHLLVLTWLSFSAAMAASQLVHFVKQPTRTCVSRRFASAAGRPRHLVHRLILIEQCCQHDHQLPSSTGFTATIVELISANRESTVIAANLEHHSLRLAKPLARPRTSVPTAACASYACSDPHVQLLPASSDCTTLQRRRLLTKANQGLLVLKVGCNCVPRLSASPGPMRYRQAPVSNRPWERNGDERSPLPSTSWDPGMPPASGLRRRGRDGSPAAEPQGGTACSSIGVVGSTSLTGYTCCRAGWLIVQLHLTQMYRMPIWCV